MLQMLDTVPKVYAWREDLFIDWEKEVNCDNIIECVDWINRFSGNNRLSNDVGLPLERCVIGAYQIGYLFDYARMKADTEKEIIARSSYFEEGIASVLLHSIAAYEMMHREYINLFEKFYWNNLCKEALHTYWNSDFQFIIYAISECNFKFQRWTLYNHMHRTKRWDEEEFKNCIRGLTMWCCSLSNLYECDLSNGFALCMSKLQDQEIKRH